MIRYDKRSCHEGRKDFTTLAATHNGVAGDPELDEASKQDIVHDKNDRHTQIQLCPWFVDWIKSKEYKTGNDAMRSNIGRAAIKFIEKNNWGFGLRQIGTSTYGRHTHV